ncbi:hypothetical protein E2C01_012673 [Portunus trituberculatus]|uniref:Uncharacterized protein n=1 Tax=Portunus trituberculatus TaxID=210409 RepID=A0A5B7DEN2_PORTR|nr:hypothetical protein [Portunus trituberculatus]
MPHTPYTCPYSASPSPRTPLQCFTLHSRHPPASRNTCHANSNQTPAASPSYAAPLTTALVTHSSPYTDIIDIALIPGFLLNHGENYQ